MAENKIKYLDMATGTLPDGQAYSVLSVHRTGAADGHPKSYWTNTTATTHPHYIPRVTRMRQMWSAFTERQMLPIIQRDMNRLTGNDDCLTCSQALECAGQYAHLSSLMSGVKPPEVDYPDSEDDREDDGADDGADDFSSFLAGLLGDMPD